MAAAVTRRAFVLALVLSTLPLAGCLGGDEVPDERRVTAAGGAATLGWAYDGVGVVGRDATLEGVLRNGDNAGVVNVTFTAEGDVYIVRFDAFAQAEGKDFMDGGVAFGLDEHGDTGVADASIPRIHATIAAWGKAIVLRNGEPEGGEPWSAHLMVSRDSVRGEDGRITKSDGATPYDPATPADARRIEGDPQVLFWVKHPRGETFARPPAGVFANVSCAAPQCAQSADLAFEPGVGVLAMNVTVVGPEAPAPIPLGALGQGRFVVVDANGTDLAAGDFTLSPGGAPGVTPVEVPLAGLALPLALQVTGDGAFTVRAEGAVTYVDRPFLVVTWDDPTLQ